MNDTEDATNDYLSLEGPVGRENGELVLRIPLDAGGEQLSLVARGISVIDGDDLVIHIPDAVAANIGILEGSQIYVDDRWGRLNLSKVETQ